MSKRKPSSLTSEQLRQLLKYNPKTGIFTWLVDCKSGSGRVHIKKGNLAGCANGPGGRRIIKIQRRIYYANVLAWLYMTGSWPPDNRDVDHEDRNKKNDCWNNLRLLSHSANIRNRNLTKLPISGISNVYWHKTRKKYHATVRLEGKTHFLGWHRHKQSARIAVDKLLISKKALI